MDENLTDRYQVKSKMKAIDEKEKAIKKVVSWQNETNEEKKRGIVSDHFCVGRSF